MSETLFEKKNDSKATVPGVSEAEAFLSFLHHFSPSPTFYNFPENVLFPESMCLELLKQLNEVRDNLNLCI